MPLIKPSRHLLTVWRLRLAVISLLPAFFSAIFYPYINWVWWVYSSAWVLAFFYFYIFYYPIKLKKLALSSNKICLLIHCGVIYTRVKAIPFSSVQYASVAAGPLERLFGICSLLVYTAGAGAYMPGLTTAQAELLQEQLSKEGFDE